MGDGSVSLSQLNKRFGDICAIRDVSLDIPSGAFVAVLGPSGSGKSTLLNLIGGLQTTDRGCIRIGGRDVTRVPAHARNVGMVFQHYALFPHMMVGENVAFPLEMRRMTAARVAERVKRALELVQLTGLEQRRPDQLSGGQQQRVALARALIHEPPVLLLDEPLGALDRRLREAMQIELKALHERLGITFVHVTHDQQEALTLADTLIVLRDGHVAQMGDVVSVYDRPRTAWVAQFVGECSIWRGRAVLIPGGFDVRHPSTGIVLHRHVGGSGQVSPGAEAAIAVRPEWLRLIPPDEHLEEFGGCRLESTEVRVTRQRFRGSELQVECESPLGPLLVRVARGRAGDELPAGDLRVGWWPQHTILLEGDG
jgi:ABC-type Fe3+/spermidine/putrescine transport system ATPase subunit